MNNERELIIKSINRWAVNIPYLGKRLVEQLVDAGLVRSIADLYDLREEQLLLLKGMGEYSARKVIDNIAQSRYLPRERVWESLGIPGVKSSLASYLSKKFLDIEKLQSLSIEELRKISGVGKSAQKIYDWLQFPANRELIERLKAIGIRVYTPESKAKGKVFAFAGSFGLNQSGEIIQVIREAGGAWWGYVDSTHQPTNEIDFIVVGNRPAAKVLKQIEELNIPVITEADLVQMIAPLQNLQDPRRETLFPKVLIKL